MQVPATIDPDTLDTILTWLTWTVAIFSVLWIGSGILGYMHRRAYNLTRAESGRSKNIQPDFLKVDKARREAAMNRGAAYDKELAERDAAEAAAAAAAAAGARAPTDSMENWSRLAAMISATFTLLAAVIGTLRKVDALQEDAQKIGSWDALVNTMSAHKIGTTIAVIVIAANVIVYVKAVRKNAAHK